MKTVSKMWVLLLMGVVLLTGCGGMESVAEPAPVEDVPVVDSDAGRVIAEGVIEPARWLEVRFDAAGTLVQVAVQEGDEVAEGDELARLETIDLERAVARAELDLRQAELRLEQLEEPPDEADVRQAEHAVAQAEDALRTARMNLTTVRDSTLLNETLEDAQEVYVEAQHYYETRLRMYESGEEPDYWFVDQAQEKLDDAKLNLDRIRQQGGLQLSSAGNDVEQAERAYQEAQDALQRLLDGPDAQEMEAAQLDIEAAELALEEARHNLEEAVVYAPFAGVVTQLDVEAGEAVTPGDVLLVLATLDQLQARSVDLTELDVARVAVGQPAVVLVDALPDVEMAGRVARIGLQSVDYRGDVTYPIYVELQNPPPDLRWGMTAVIEVEVE